MAFDNTQAVIWEEIATLTIHKDENSQFWFASIRDDNGEIVDAQATAFDSLLEALEENCTEWLDEQSS